MAIDLSSLNPRELKKLIDDASRERKRKEKRAPVAAVRKKLTKMAVAEGYTLMELFGLQAPPKPVRTGAPTVPKRGSTRKSTAGSKVAPKYRNPDNPAETWSGRGKHPKWMTQAMEAHGRKPEDFLIS